MLAPKEKASIHLCEIIAKKITSASLLFVWTPSARPPMMLRTDNMIRFMLLFQTAFPFLFMSLDSIYVY